MTALVTFKGWEGKWWKNIKPGRAALDAALTVMPGAGAVATIGKRAVAGVGPKLIRKASGRIGRWWRNRGAPKRPGVHPGIRAARGGSAITSGKLDLGAGQAFRAGGTAFNIRNAAKVAAVGTGGAVAVGKLVQPRAAVTSATLGVSPRMSSAPTSSPAPRSSPAPLSSPASSSSGAPRRCGCPPGQRMLCFKRRHNPEAEAKRRARRKAAREKSKAKTAKRTAKAKAAASRRKSARAARGVRRALRGRR